METEEFESELGKVALTKGHLERKKSDSEDWDIIHENFPEEKILEYASYRDIEEIEYEEGSIFPNIRVKIDGDWKRLFFRVGDQAEECFKRLRYRWNSFREVY